MKAMKAKKLYILFALGLAVTAVLAVRPIRAYWTQKTLLASGGITNIKWSSSSFPVVWQMNPVQGSNITGSRSQASVIALAFSAWQNAAAVSATQGADTAATVKAGQIDGINVITSNTGPTDMPAGVLAVTYPIYTDAGQIVEADMAFSTSTAIPPYTLNSTPTSSQIDFQSVATHEAGHFFGMDHATNTSSTMFWTTGSGYTYQRNLSSDDIAGISSIYPPATFSQTGTLQGKVQTTAGSPVYGAIVVAVNASGTPVASTLTDPSGNYSIQGLAAGSYTVYAEPLSGRITIANIITLPSIYSAGTNVNTAFTVRYH